MTQPHEVTVSDAEVEAFFEKHAATDIKTALAAFLAKRVPDARDASDEDDAVGYCNAGFNDCRDAVLKGPQG